MLDTLSFNLRWCTESIGLELNKKNIFPDFAQPAFAAQLNLLCYCILFGLVQNCLIFWRKVFTCFSVILSLPIDPKPVMALFGILPESVQLNILQADSVAFAALLARRLILMNWKSAAPPPYQWVFDFLHALRMEKIRFAIKQKPKLFLKYFKETTVT